MSASDFSSLITAALLVACLVYLFAHVAAGVPVFYP